MELSSISQGSGYLGLKNEVAILKKEEKIPDKENIQPEKAKPNGQKLDEADNLNIEALKKRDKEVKAHENAHKAAAAGLTVGTTSLKYVTGPDGKRYAIGGNVKIDVAPVPGDPEATIAKAAKIKSAALAPAVPSSQDRRVAFQAMKLEAEAKKEVSAENKEQMENGNQKSEFDNANGIVGSESSNINQDEARFKIARDQSTVYKAIEENSKYRNDIDIRSLNIK